MNKYLLSPRSMFDKNRGGYAMCPECKSDVTSRNSDVYPSRAIGNGYWFGSPPPSLLKLNEAELAVLSPVHCYGHCIVWNGGTELRGTLSYFKIKPTEITKTVLVASKLASRLTKDIVFIFSGKMTKQQRERAKERCAVRVSYMIEAITWLVENHTGWAEVDIDKIEAEIKASQPVVIDMAETIEEDEMHNPKGCLESFSVYLPDGTMSNAYGGCANAREFEETVMKAQDLGFDGEVVVRMSPEFCRDYLEFNFVDSCPLQFPYGIGGPNEVRTNKRGGCFYPDYQCYAEHLSNLSQPTMHRPLFVLKLFNMKLRCRILRGATQQLHGLRSIGNLHKELETLDFAAAARAKVSGIHSGSTASKQFLSSIDAIHRGLPHTNDAAKKARQMMDAMQHHFNIGGIFLTVTPDDENSFLVTSYSQFDQSGSFQDVLSISKAELEQKAKKRMELRLQYPGITALAFEHILDIIIEEVIGWDVKKGRPTEAPGLFGEPLAFAGAVEEQGRKTLHVHFIIWLKGFLHYLKSATSGNTKEREQAQRHVRNIVDNSITTNLFSFERPNSRTKKSDVITKCFDHSDCTARDPSSRRPPQVVNEQGLRNLRHKGFKKHCKGVLVFAVCPLCDRKWSYEDMVRDYLRNHKRYPIDHFPDYDNYLQELCYQYTKPNSGRSVDPAVVRAVNDAHRSRHVASCFKCNSESGTEKRPFSDECRMRLPETKQNQTTIEPVPLASNGDSDIPWHLWTGTKVIRSVVRVTPQRGDYDLFQNASCWPIGESKIGGNTNARIITPGPIGLCTVKYPVKNTQSSDTEPYHYVVDALSRALTNPQLCQTERQENLRLLMSAGCAHAKTNVVGASMASYLTRNRSRYIFSHEFAFVPLQDLVRLLLSKTIERTYIKSYHGKAYAEAFALHYLCRPSVLADCSPMKFFEHYEAIQASVSRRRQDILDFENAQHFKHTALVFNEATGVMKRHMVLRKRVIKRLPQVSQFGFEDTAVFKGEDILSCHVSHITPQMESHALSVLALCTNYYCLDDLKINDSCVLKLRAIFKAGLLDEHTDFLQNLQDSKANFGRIKPTHDSLQLNTDPFVDKQNTVDPDDDEDEPNDVSRHETTLQGEELNDMISALEAQMMQTNRNLQKHKDKFSTSFVPKSLDVDRIRLRGSYNCGRNNLCQVTIRNCKTREGRSFFDHSELQGTKPSDVPHTEADGHNLSNQQTGVSASSRPSTSRESGLQNSGPLHARTRPTRSFIVEVAFKRKKTKKRHLPSLFKKGEKRKFPAANGTALSIVGWKMVSGLDEEQGRAFEIFASSFVLSFYADADQTCPDRMRDFEFASERIRLLKLAGRVNPQDRTEKADILAARNLVCFLHGQGGSGKSAVLEVLVEYARGYCVFVKENFTDATIMVTAMSGVAATLIGGKTTHSALRLRADKSNITRSKEAWKATRMLIVDEISFASKSDVERMEDKVKYLVDCPSQVYGGIDVIFCGDLRQLEPCNKKAVRICEEQFDQFHGAINCYIELNGMHRFSTDIEWGHLLRRCREGVMTEADLHKINSRCVKTSALPRDVQYATHFNKDRASINVGLIESCKTLQQGNGIGAANCIAILSCNLSVRDGHGAHRPKDNAFEQWFWENCGEGDCTPDPFNGRFDPVLVLYYNRPVMVNANDNVGNGVANGSRVRVVKVVLRHGVQPTFLKLGTRQFPVVRADHVHSILLRHEKEHMSPQVFELVPREHGFTASISIQNLCSRAGGNSQTERLKMRGLQLPVVCNNATTGHKLQGASVDATFVHSWSKVQNWIYVVLSRVKKLEGLYVRNPLPLSFLEKINSMPEKLTKMLQKFRKEKTTNKTPLNGKQCDLIFKGAERDWVETQTRHSTP